MKIIENELDGRKVAYCEETMFYVEIGRYKSSYRVRYSFKGNLGQAVRMYNGINIGNGYKKRLSMNDITLSRFISR